MPHPFVYFAFPAGTTRKVCFMREMLSAASTPLLSNLQKLQDNFARATGLATVLLDAQGEAITRVSGQTQLYETITQNNEGNKLYQNSIQRLCRLTRESGEACHITCEHTGLLMGSLPVSVNGNQIACWVVGQARENIHLDHYTMFSLNLAVATGLSSMELNIQYSALPQLSSYAFKVYMQLLQSINLLCLQSTLFLPEDIRHGIQVPADSLLGLFDGYHSEYLTDGQHMESLLADLMEFSRLRSPAPSEAAKSPA